MISTKILEQKINDLISGGNLTELQVTQLLSAAKSLENNSFLNVQTFSDLPDIANNLGRLVYVVDEEQFYFSDGDDLGWTNNFDTNFIADADIYSSGNNFFNGQLGDNTITDRSSPVTVIGNISDWSQVSAGYDHSLSLTDSGIAYAWGNNTKGQLGDNTTTRKSSPVTVIGGITNWSQVSGGDYFSLGLTNSGIAYAWGDNDSGRLGDGTTTDRSSPVTVIGGITNWSQVSSGEKHSLGVTDDGIAYAWGYNTKGQVGDGTIISKLSPVTVIGGISNWSQVSAGQQHSLGVTDDGIAYAWGNGNSGRLGTDIAFTSKSSPVSVVGGISNWSQVSAGNEHSLGVTDDGIAYAWGENINGCLGDGTRADRSSPVTVIAGITNWSQVSSGGKHSLGVTDDGIAYAWGNNFHGRLGDGTEANKSSPVTVIGGISNWSQVSGGGDHSLLFSKVQKGFNEVS